MSVGWARHGLLDHAAVFHRGPDALADAMSGPLLDAVDAGDAVLVSLRPDDWRPLEARLGDAARRVTWLHADDRYATPAGAMLALHRFATDALAAAAPAVWSLGALPFEGSGDDDRWIRYEHAVNDVLRELPIHAVCAYDLDQVPEAVLAHAVAAHATHHGVDLPADPTPPSATPAPSIVVPDDPPVVDDDVESASHARAATRAALGPTVDPDVLDDLMIITTELSSNALRHGRPPVRLRLWSTPEAVVVQVRDTGAGIADPYAELRPARTDGGRGLNMVAQLADLRFGHDGTTATSTACIRR